MNFKPSKSFSQWLQSWRSRSRRTIPTFIGLFATTLLLLLATQGFWDGNSGANRGDRPLNPTIEQTLFGKHIHHLIKTTRRMPEPTPWPYVPFGSWRLWDAYVAWPNLEPQQDQWNFELLDSYVEIAREKNVELLLVLSLSPRWASARPDEPSGYGPGNAAEPANIEDWRDFVRTVATRYRGKIHYYELWNEPNGYKRFYTGSLDKMLELSREAYQILKAVDPSVTVVSPAATGDSGSSPGVQWLADYLAAGGGAYADVIGYHFYVMPGSPENMLDLIGKVQGVMKKYGVADKPLWNTEAGWLGDRPFENSQKSAAYVARSYILNWKAGVRRLYWYDWDYNPIVSLRMLQEDNRTMTAAGFAYGEIQRWLVGSRMKRCEADWQSTWTCELEREGGDRAWILWNPEGTRTVDIPQRWSVRQVRDLQGKRRPLTQNSLEISFSPLLLERSPLTSAIDSEANEDDL